MTEHIHAYHDEEGVPIHPSQEGRKLRLYYSVGSSKHEGLSGTGTNAYGTTNPVDGQCDLFQRPVLPKPDHTSHDNHITIKQGESNMQPQTYKTNPIWYPRLLHPGVINNCPSGCFSIHRAQRRV